MGDEHPTTRVAAVSSTLRDEPGGSSGHVRADAMALEVACVTHIGHSQLVGEWR